MSETVGYVRVSTTRQVLDRQHAAPNAAGAVKALTEATDAFLEELVKWTAQTARAPATPSCSKRGQPSAARSSCRTSRARTTSSRSVEAGAVANVVLNLIVLRSADLDRAAQFYSRLGIVFSRERHGSGPEHLA